MNISKISIHELSFLQLSDSFFKWYVVREYLLFMRDRTGL
jgi:hypothetical protein